uniref:Neur_chan_memb domain-containing protein n=1 Tax=Ascaris lumbricoides TaxID=6252 RepID=A0A0M3IPC0_ASCLU
MVVNAATVSGVFYLAILFVIFIGTMFTAFVLNVHLQKIYARPVPPFVAKLFFKKAAPFLLLDPPVALLELWSETGFDFTQGKLKKTAVTKNHSRILIKSSQTIRRKIERDSSVLTIQNSTGGHKYVKKTGGGESVDPATDRPKEESTAKKVLTHLPAESKTARGNWRILARTMSMKGGEASEADRADDLCLKTTLSQITTSNPTQLVRMEMSLRRRYALEWEFLASVLDRILLILFVFVVLVVTGLMMFIGEAMYFAYDIAQQKSQLLKA